MPDATQITLAEQAQHLARQHGYDVIVHAADVSDFVGAKRFGFVFEANDQRAAVASETPYTADDLPMLALTAIGFSKRVSGTVH